MAQITSIERTTVTANSFRTELRCTGNFEALDNGFACPILALQLIRIHVIYSLW
jgi:hypothetical protein